MRVIFTSLLPQLGKYEGAEKGRLLRVFQRRAVQQSGSQAEGNAPYLGTTIVGAIRGKTSGDSFPSFTSRPSGRGGAPRRFPPVVGEIRGKSVYSKFYEEKPLDNQGVRTGGCCLLVNSRYWGEFTRTQKGRLLRVLRGKDVLQAVSQERRMRPLLVCSPCRGNSRWGSRDLYSEFYEEKTSYKPSVRKGGCSSQIYFRC